jgi:hypothetical protein
MAQQTQPNEAQLIAARSALLHLVAHPTRDALWRSAHAALCRVEERLGMTYTHPPRSVRRTIDEERSAMLE